VLATGDELVLPGTTPGPGQIVLSNGYALRALARNEGAEAIDLGVAADTMEATTAAIRRARDSGADILVTTGGASVGDHDLMNRALEAEGVEMAFWKVALRPGKPMMHGRLPRASGAMRVIGLPGNPTSSYICAFLFMAPLLRALSGHRDIHHPLETATLGNDLRANDQRQDYLRARIETKPDGTVIASTVTHQDSSLLVNLATARALIVRPPHAPAAKAGEPCAILRLPA
jgi:molybdopterin molybdotransferase